MAPPPEIAIPSTSVSDEGTPKAHTLYNISLRLPLRSFVVQKRYSDFTKLHGALMEQVGARPPAPLPGKYWLKSTVRSADLTRDRQLGLERYLRAIAEAPDRRWRDTPAWRAFLNLPNSSATASAVSAAGTSGNTAAGAADPGTWLDLHRELKQCLHEARQCLSRRDAAAEAGDDTAVAETATAAKRALVKGGTLIVGLSDGLGKMHELARLGDGELRRRRDLVSASRLERDGLEKLASRMPLSTSVPSRRDGDERRESAWNQAGSSQGNRPGGRVLGAPLPETSQTRELDNEGVLMLQKEEMRAQDEQVEQLAAMIRRQKEIGLQMNEEVEAQGEMLDRLDQDVTRVQGKIKVANRRIKKM